MTWIRKSYNLYEKENTAMFVLGIDTVRRSTDGSFTTCADEFRLMGEYVDGATTCGEANEGASKYWENYGSAATDEELCEREEEH
ncbi:hypothetical protein RIF29_00111 [Crotalaria pallida]|uniref:Uncharacterized protein n=1 Tax=Crotalaria pallida TaxID=3830 RepID=A0AAN9IVD4_CROPI